MVAVVVTVMAYETILEGMHLLSHPAHTTGLWLTVTVLLLALATDGYVLIKAMKEIVHESRIEAKGLSIFYIDGITTIVIGVLMVGVAFRVGYDNMVGLIELKRGLSLAEADDIKFHVRDKLLGDPHISDVTLGIIEDNGVTDWDAKEQAD